MVAALTCDTSVLVAALSAWHTEHAVARPVLGRIDWLGAHVLAETVSVLSRMPHGHSVLLVEAVAVTRRVADGRIRQLRGDRYLTVFGAVGAAGIGGGAVYDAIVGATARENEATLLTLDSRALRTYAAVGARHELLGHA